MLKYTTALGLMLVLSSAVSAQVVGKEDASHVTVKAASKLNTPKGFGKGSVLNFSSDDELSDEDSFSDERKPVAQKRIDLKDKEDSYGIVSYLKSFVIVQKICALFGW